LCTSGTGGSVVPFDKDPDYDLPFHGFEEDPEMIKSNGFVNQIFTGPFTFIDRKYYKKYSSNLPIQLRNKFLLISEPVHHSPDESVFPSHPNIFNSKISNVIIKC